MLPDTQSTTSPGARPASGVSTFLSPAAFACARGRWAPRFSIPPSAGLGPMDVNIYQRRRQALGYGFLRL